MGPHCSARGLGRAIALLCGLGGCTAHDAGPVLRHPWVEDHSLALTEEQLIIEVGPTDVSVEARFEFRARGEPRDRVMSFVIPPPCEQARGLTATLEEGGRVPLSLASRSGTEPTLPMGAVSETHDVAVPGASLARYRWLVVRYRQTCSDSFRYTLLTGAYWHGPIGDLEIDLLDPSARVVAASVEGQRAHDRSAARYHWSFRDLEPSSGVVLRLLPN